MLQAQESNTCRKKMISLGAQANLKARSSSLAVSQSVQLPALLWLQLSRERRGAELFLSKIHACALLTLARGAVVGWCVCVCVCVCVCLLGDVWRVGGKMEGEWLKEGRINFRRLSVHFACTRLHKRQCRPAPGRQSPPPSTPRCT